MFSLFKRKKTSVSDEVLVIYGTKTGNSKLVAESTVKYLEKSGVKTKSFNMSKIHPKTLENVKKAFFVVSTHDEGTPPPHAIIFFEKLDSRFVQNLAQLEYSVCALGDSSYDLFCGAGIELNKKLKSLGAQNVVPNVECDLEFAKPVSKWIKSLSATKVDTGDYSTIVEKQKFSGVISKRVLLQSTEEGQEVYHLELEADGENLDWQTGDLLEIVPDSPRALVQLLLEHFNKEDTFADILKRKELTQLSEKFIVSYSEKYQQQNLQELIQSEKGITELIEQANVYDLISIFPSKISFDELVKFLPNCKPRQYSISNCRTNDAGTIHLILKAVRYSYNSHQHVGAASSTLTQELKLGDRITFSLNPNFDFRLNEKDDCPYVFIANGTGIATFRAFLMQLYQINYKANIWLVWGEQKHNLQNLYFNEMLQLQKSMSNLKIDFVESRTGATIKYVQDQLANDAEMLINMIDNKAKIYLCGSIAMGQAVSKKIAAILGNSMFEKLNAENRIHRSLY